MSQTGLHIGSIVLRVDNLQRQAAFWEAALGYVRRPEPDDTSQMLMPADAWARDHTVGPSPPRL